MENIDYEQWRTLSSNHEGIWVSPLNLRAHHFGQTHVWLIHCLTIGVDTFVENYL